MIACIRDGHEVTLSNILSGFSIEEKGTITGIFAKSHDKNSTQEMLNDYIDVLLLHKNRIKAADAATIPLEQIEEYSKILKEKKTGKN